MDRLNKLADRAASGQRLDDVEVWELRLAPSEPQAAIEPLRDGLGPRITFSKKVISRDEAVSRFVRLLHLRSPSGSRGSGPTIDGVLEIARAGEAQGCREALFTLGDKPERKWTEARDEIECSRLRDDDRGSTWRPHAGQCSRRQRSSHTPIRERSLRRRRVSFVRSALARG